MLDGGPCLCKIIQHSHVAQHQNLVGKDGKEKTLYIYNICDHEDAYAETGNQAVSYTTGVPAMIGAAMLLTGKWSGAGVWNIEQFDPDPFMDMLNAHGLPWQVKELDGPLTF